MSNADIIAPNVKIVPYDFDPDATTATEIGWIDMSEYRAIMIVFIRTVGTGDIDTFKIMANSASDGSSTDVDVVSKTISSQPDAVGDMIVLEASAQQIAQAAAEDDESDVRYVTAVVEAATATDEGVVLYVLLPKRPQDGLTSDDIAA